MIPEAGWMFGDELPDDTVAALVMLPAVQWAVIAMHAAGGEDPRQ